MLANRCFCRLLAGLLLIVTLGQTARAQTPAVAADFREARSEYERLNAVKVNLVMLMHGYGAIGFERLFFERLGVEVGGGPTRKDFLYFSELMPLITGVDEGDDVDYGQFKTAKTGFGGYGSLRLYLGDMRSLEPTGAYLALQAQHRQYQWTQQFSGDNYEFIVDQERKLTEALLLFGVQDIWDNNMVFEFNLGVGSRNESYNRKRLIDNATLVDYPPASSVIAYAFNLKIGYAF